MVKVSFKAHIGQICPEMYAMAKIANMYHIGRATTHILTLLVQGGANSESSLNYRRPFESPTLSENSESTNR